MEERQEIPLFPLRTVLFPGGRLSLQIFEKRYIDLIADSLRNDSNFGVTLLRGGKEVMEPGRDPVLYRVGTEAHITDWNQLQNGLLGISIEGRRKFEVERYWQLESGLYMGEVVFRENGSFKPKKIPVGEEVAGLTELLQVLEKHPMVQEMKLEIDYENLWDVGWRLSELIPVAMEIKQELLELDDPWERIRLVEQSIHFLLDD